MINTTIIAPLTRALNPRPDVADHVERILIVDDDRHNRELLEAMLAADGYAVRTAESGPAALSSVAEQAPDLILLDVMMPGMDGYEVVRAFKEQRATRSIPIIIVTALDDSAARMFALRVGAEEVLTKPVDRAELRVRVKNLLRLKAYGDHYDKYSQRLERELGSREAELASAALITAEERMRVALESANVGIWDMDYTNGVLEWSDTVAAHYGLQPGRFEKTFEAFVARIHPDDRQSVLDTLATAKISGGDFAIQNRSLWPDGTVRWLTGAGRIFLDAQGEPVRGIGISQDVTDHLGLVRQPQQA